MLASFEMTTDHLYNSAIQCKKDDIQGVTECIVMGTQVPIGTGMFKLCHDETVKPTDGTGVAQTTQPAVNRRQKAAANKSQQKRNEKLVISAVKEKEKLLFDGIF